MKLHKFEDMNVWQQSRILVRAVRAICKRPPVRYDYPFIDQVTRSARSISANIAEGSDALTTKEFIVYLGHSKRSAAEVRSHLYDAFDEKYITEKEFSALTDLTKKIQSMLAKFIHHLQSLNSDYKRTYKNI